MGNKHHFGIYTVAGSSSVIHSLHLILCDVNMKRDIIIYRGTDKSLARPGTKQATRQKILVFICPIYNYNWRNISTIYIYNKTGIKRNILTIKQNTSGSRSG